MIWLSAFEPPPREVKPRTEQSEVRSRQKEAAAERVRLGLPPARKGPKPRGGPSAGSLSESESLACQAAAANAAAAAVTAAAAVAPAAAVASAATAPSAVASSADASSAIDHAAAVAPLPGQGSNEAPASSAAGSNKAPVLRLGPAPAAWSAITSACATPSMMLSSRTSPWLQIPPTMYPSSATTPFIYPTWHPPSPIYLPSASPLPQLATALCPSFPIAWFPPSPIVLPPASPLPQLATALCPSFPTARVLVHGKDLQPAQRVQMANEEMEALYDQAQTASNDVAAALAIAAFASTSMDGGAGIPSTSAQEASQAKAVQEAAAKAAQEAAQAKAVQEAAQAKAAQEAAAKAAQEAAAKAAHETMLRRESDAAAIEREGVVADEWERFELRCVLSFAPLTDPAKGSSCMHRACFNYDVLRDYVGRVGKAGQIKECPLATCRARLQRTRDVERDSMLKTALSAAPPNTTSVWLRGHEVRMEAASTAVEANGRSGGRKRSRRGTTLEVESDNLSLRRSGRRCVIVL